MKQTEKLILVIFVLTCILFGIYAGGGYLTRDKEGPVITMKEETIKASIEDSDKKLLEGVVAKDKRDGDVSDSLIIESIQMKEENQCTIVCAAFDQSNNVSKASRTVIFEDYTPIHFSISKPLCFPIGSTEEILQSITASDCMDGNITSKIKLTSQDEDSDYNGAGVFDYQVEVTNSIGDTAVLPISVEFYTDSYEERLFRPNLYLKKYLIYLKKGSEFEPKAYLDSVGIGNTLYAFQENVSSEESETVSASEENEMKVNEDGEQITGIISYDTVKYQSNVETDKEGTYTVEYSCTTKAGYTGTTQMIVVVE